MAPEETSSPLTRFVPGLTVFALVVMISAAIYHVVNLKPEMAPGFKETTLPAAPDYTTKEAWLVRPEAENRKGGWERPWGVDLIWFPDRPLGYLSGWNVPYDWPSSRESFVRDIWISEVSEPEFELFVPSRRFATNLHGEDSDYQSALQIEHDDAIASTNEYFTNDQIQRGYFLGGRGTGLASALAVYENELAIGSSNLEFLGGFVVAPDEVAEIPQIAASLPSCEAEMKSYPCLLDLRVAATETNAADRVNKAISAYSEWLDANAAKPAAPLPPMETIEFAPIHRPGEPVEN